jgi:hypothetical protein
MSEYYVSHDGVIRRAKTKVMSREDALNALRPYFEGQVVTLEYALHAYQLVEAALVAYAKDHPPTRALKTGKQIQTVVDTHVRQLPIKRALGLSGRRKKTS